MPGVAPKDPGQRRRYNQPAKGEWIDLPAALERPILPEYDPAWQEWVTARDREGYEIEVRRGVDPEMWDAWRSSPVTTQYGPEDIAAICYLAQAFHTLTDASRFAMMDRLGLTPKGKRDLRWRNVAEAQAMEKANEKAANVRRLRAMSEREAS